ncbi:type II pantothenate kinase [Cohnella sp. CBP 2801]|uniref:Type II pantothenate kinase n=2 Tax=Cohnella zeiphila TaxID=2761120 RepID=A0A7X0VX33_9BACL|nr:type II pantothenate kinase [Cohnella zeiphila]
MKIGVDAGGTLVKVACEKGGAIEYFKRPSSELRAVADWLREQEGAAVCLTGGRAAALKSLAGIPVAETVEFEATCRGASRLLSDAGAEPDSFLLTNVGTGTSIHHVANGRQRRVGGTGVGGGTIIGLARLLTGQTDFDAVVRLAAQGRRDRIDLTVNHIYEGAEPPIPGDLTASNFGRVLSLASSERLSEEDLLASVIGLVGETAATVSVLAASSCGVSSILFVGSSFIRNDLLRDVVKRYTVLRGGSPLFVEGGEYSGALGALLSLD